MKAAVRFALCVIVFSGLTGASLSADEGAPRIDGIYVAAGRNPDGTEYRQVVHIARHGQSYLVSWMGPEESAEMLVLEPRAIGIGIVRGEMFGVSYFSEEEAGIVVYAIEEGGRRLAGQWTGAGEDGELHSETLTRLPEIPAPVEADPHAPPSVRRPARRSAFD
jgi:hypothetical protein